MNEVHRLRSFDVNPSGNFPYEEPAPYARSFPAEPMIEAQAAIVSKYRIAMNKPRSSVPECIDDISIFTCQRLGGNSTYCTGTNGTPMRSFPAGGQPVPCATCGKPPGT